jgi:hypothetical protein
LDSKDLKHDLKREKSQVAKFDKEFMPFSTQAKFQKQSPKKDKK